MKVKRKSLLERAQRARQRKEEARERGDATELFYHLGYANAMEEIAARGMRHTRSKKRETI